MKKARIITIQLSIEHYVRQECGNTFYSMTSGLLEHAQGNYKSEWDSPITNMANLPPVPDYDEIMIWDSNPGRSSDDDDMNPEDGLVGDFTHPDFFEQMDGGEFGGDRTSGAGGAEENSRPLGMQNLDNIT